MLLDDAILEELEDIQRKIKTKETENEALNRTLEETQNWMFELRTEHDSLVANAAVVKEAAQNPSRVRRYDPSVAAAASNLLQQQDEVRPQSEENNRSNHSACPGDVAVVHDLGESATHKLAPDGGAHMAQMNKSGDSSQSSPMGKSLQDVGHREEPKAPEADLISQIQNDPRKIQEQIAAKKAEMERLQKLLEKTRRDAARGDDHIEAHEVFSFLLNFHLLLFLVLCASYFQICIPGHLC